MVTTYYPTSPQNLPKRLTALTPSYQFKAFLAILAILLFFVLYTVMVAGLGYLLYYAITYDMIRINKLTILMKVGAIAGAGMLFVFTLKFIFKLKNHRPENRIKLNRSEHSKLWDFIHEICKQTGAPKPKNIYVDPDVNAYVAYSNMWLSLFLPVRKELTIGMGLTDCLNLSEFKAVMSHEFGHFAQRSMKIGSYIISANTIIHDMIFERDKWDDLLEQWRASDLRLSAAAWIITPVIWLVRQMLNLFYQFLNIMYSSLSREMEFNADKVAVKTSGSDAIISALWKLDGGANAWGNTLNHGILAARKSIFVDNLYENNAKAIERLSEAQQSLYQALPEDTRGDGKKYFSSPEHSKAGMYASHPPNDKREESAKDPFVVCEADERSPWILFGEKEKLQQEMTVLLYKMYMDKIPEETKGSEVLEAFIKSETQGEELSKEYADTFLNRYLQIPNSWEIVQKQEQLKEPSKNGLEDLKTRVKQLMEPVVEMEALMLKAQEIAQGTTKEKSFSFKGITYDKKNLENGYNFLLNQRETYFNEQFKEWDADFCAFFLALSKKNGSLDELKKLYKQHEAFCSFYKAATSAKNKIYQRVMDLQNAGEVSKEQLHSLTANVKQSFEELNVELDGFSASDFIKMPNIDSVEELKEAFVENGKLKIAHGLIFENGGFQKMMDQLEMSIQNCQRIDQKSVACILEFHKELEQTLAV